MFDFFSTARTVEGLSRLSCELVELVVARLVLEVEGVAGKVLNFLAGEEGLAADRAKLLARGVDIDARVVDKFLVFAWERSDRVSSIWVTKAS